MYYIYLYLKPYVLKRWKIYLLQLEKIRNRKLKKSINAVCLEWESHENNQELSCTYIEFTYILYFEF